MKVSPFLPNDPQVVHRRVISSSDEILEVAPARNAQILEHELEIQFLSGGSDESVRWVENALAIRRPVNAI